MSRVFCVCEASPAVSLQIQPSLDWHTFAHFSFYSFAGLTDADRVMCTQTWLLVISSSTVRLSCILSCQLKSSQQNLHPIAHLYLKLMHICLTAGVSGPFYRSLRPALCPLQLAVVDFCSPFCRLLTRAAGVPANFCPRPCLLLEMNSSLTSFIFSSIS